MNGMRPLLLLLASLLLTTSGCRRKSMTLEYVVPNGFSGVLRLRAGVADGVKLTATNETVTLVFPESGTLNLKGSLPTLDWHKPLARFVDGTPIPIPGPAVAVSDDVVALRGLGVKNNTTESWYLVGKADQMQEAMNQFYGFAVPKR